MRSRQYPHLRFAANVDYERMKPELLSKLNRLGALAHVIIDIFSGYRSNEYSAAHGGFAGDPHTKGIAADANVNGKPIGLVISAKLFKKVGLRSGNQPNFYKGKPDPSHVDLVGEGGGSTGAAPKPQRDAAQPDAAPQPVAPIPETGSPAPIPDPSAVGPPILAPGTVQADNFSQRSVSELWRLISAQPNASPDSQMYASLAGGSSANQ